MPAAAYGVVPHCLFATIQFVRHSADILGMHKTLQGGFTLLELLMALAVAAILLGIGAPGLSRMAQESRLASVHNALAGSLHLARSEAIKSSSPVTLCARASDTSCGTLWENGWLVFADGATVGSIDAGEAVLRVVAPAGAGRSIDAIGSADRGAGSATARTFIRFGADGSTDWQGGSFVVCDERGVDHARVLNIVFTGDARRGYKSTSSDVPLNVFGLPITCTS